MRDPHTRESRGFGFVKMVTSDQADAAKNGLNGEVIEGRTLSIEKARRSKPRTPTPGKYFGPPKRGTYIHASADLPADKLAEDRRGGGRGGYGGDRYGDDRRGYGGGRRDDYRDRGYRDRYDDRGYRDRYDDRGYGGGRRDRGDDRGGRDDRYSRDDRRGGGYGGGGYDRPPRDAAYADGGAPPARGGGSRGGYEDDRYAGR